MWGGGIRFYVEDDEGEIVVLFFRAAGIFLLCGEGAPLLRVGRQKQSGEGSVMGVLKRGGSFSFFF